MTPALQGDLKNVPLADVLQSLRMNSQRGTLTARGVKKEIRLHFDKDHIDCISPGVESSEYLPQILCVRLGIEERELQRLLGRRRKRSIAEQLQRARLTDATTVIHLHRIYLLEHLYDAFTWKKGTFEFVDCRVPGGDFDTDQRAAAFSLPLEQTVLEAMRRQDEWKLIRRVIPTMDDVFIVSDLYKSQMVQITEPAQSILALCDGEHTVTQIAWQLGLETFTVARVLASHVKINYLRVVTAEDLAALAERHLEKGDIAGALRFYKRSVETDGANTDVRAQYAGLCRQSGDLTTATSEYKTLAQIAREREDYVRARQYYQAVIEMNPSDHQTQHRLYTMLREANAEGTHATGLALAATLERLGLRSEEIEVLRGMARDEPEATDVLERLGDALQAVGQKETAGESFSAAARLCADRGDISAACTLYQKALRVRPDNPADRRALEDLQSGIYHERKNRRKRNIRTAAATLCAVLVFAYAAYNVAAVAAYLDLRNSHIARLIAEECRGCDDSLRRFASQYPLSLVLFDISRYRAVLPTGSRDSVRVLLVPPSADDTWMTPLDSCRADSAGVEQGEAERSTR